MRFDAGHGLSYTAFRYSNLTSSRTDSASASAKELENMLTVSAIVSNVGSHAGCEVAQLYVTFPPDAAEPPRLLRGFVKTTVLQPAASERVSFGLRPQDLSTWDVVSHDWKLEVGNFLFEIGSSSANIRLSASLEITHL
jgi:beta-glucosidase